MNNFLLGIFLATLILSLFSMRVYRLLVWYSLNSLALGIIAISIGISTVDNGIIITGILTIILKSIGIPFMLRKFSRKFKLERSAPPKIGAQYAIIVVPVILIFTFYLAEPIGNVIGANITYISASISALFLSLLLIIQHTKITPKIVGFLTMENSLFLLGATATNGMPMLIELGIFFDLLMAIVIINLLFSKEEMAKC